MPVAHQEIAPQAPPTEAVAEGSRQLLDSALAEFTARGAHEFDDPATKEATLEAASHLSSEFGIKPGFFENPARTLVFLAAAYELAAGDSTSKEKALDITYLLSKGFAEKDLGLAEKSGLSDEEQVAATERYADLELSEQLRQLISETGVLADIEQKLGGERPFDLKVLDIASEETEYGLGIDLPDSETLEAFREWEASDDKLKAEIARLKENETQLRSELGLGSGLLPMAWVSYANSHPTLYVHKSTAYKILGAEGKVRHNYSQEDKARDLALLRHEFVHTQNFSGLNTESLAGITLEERRAELLSGDHHGYMDVKGFFGDIKAATGLDVEALLVEHAAENDPSTVYLEIAKKFGLSAMLEVAMVQPVPYAQKAEAKEDKASTALQHEIGGYTAVIDRIVEKFGDESLLGAYAEDMSKRLHEADLDPEFWASYFSGDGEPSIVKKRVAERYQRLFG